VFRGYWARTNGVLLLIVAIAMFITSAVLWFGLGEYRGKDARTVIVLGIGVVGLIPLVLAILQFRTAAAQDRILRTGTTGTATVQSIRQTGTRVNDQPEVEFNLLVRLPDRKPYPAQRTEIVPLILLNRLGDAELPVRVDPADPATVVIAWEDPAAPRP
jgi:hypothetical protein